MTSSSSPIRYFVLFLTCMLMVGNYYCFDNPAALKTQIRGNFRSLSNERFELLYGLLYTVYSLPNIVLPFMAGILVDRIGNRPCLVLFATLILIGQAIFAAGLSLHHFNLMLLGRFIFGLGGESLGVAQSCLIVSWFQSKDLALALGINLSIARLGSVINNMVSPFLAHAHGVSYALWFGVAICIGSCGAVALVLPLDAARTTQRQPPTGGTAKKTISWAKIWRDLTSFSTLYWLLVGSCVVVYGCVLPFNNIASSLLMERDFFQPPPRGCERCGSGQYLNDTRCTQATLDPMHHGCPASPPYAWPLPHLSATCVDLIDPKDQWTCTQTPPLIQPRAIDCAAVAWQHGPLSADYCAVKAAAETKAGTAMSVPYFISALLSPLLGLVVDRYGQRAFLAALAPMALVLVHLGLGYGTTSFHLSSLGPLILQGLAYSVFAAALWPSVPHLVRPELVGSAYGIITSVQNIGLAGFPMVVAAVYNLHDAYIPYVELVFVGLALVGVLLGLAINVLDTTQNQGRLNRGKATVSRPSRTSSNETRMEPRDLMMESHDLFHTETLRTPLLEATV